MEFDLKEYRRLLGETRDHLAGFNERHWTPRLGEWMAELDHLSQKDIPQHLTRTRKSLFGMGAVADISIIPEAGLSIPNDEAAISKANEKLLSLATALARETERILGQQVP